MRAANAALEQRCPLVCFSASGGARMQEALISLMQMAKTSAVLARLREEGIPFVSVLTDPVYGGVSASLAMLCDVIVAGAPCVDRLCRPARDRANRARGCQKASSAASSCWNTVPSI